ncbi:NAD(P)H-hydrate dehydratase [Dietzia kunjamensis]|uniref:NAD(P)H-hydrate dehydratase n=1 Tax=Dietzia kunjamensis TaxID=322509 RepID=UPI002096AF8D|nr:NAD(P)H-hydrate dehydratase [Dietzia kunjamensis]USX47078.1 NAD(P)H-hydrate dehydratase [Dietzia kunjamensis]
MTGEVSSESVLTHHALRDWALPSPGGGKEGRGRVLVVGGSRSTPGAVLLAAEATLRCGAGKLQIATAGSVSSSLAIHFPESKSIGLPEDDAGELTAAGADTIVELAEGCDAVVLGPGICEKVAAVDLLSDVVPRLDTTLVLDALGMAYVTENPGGLAHLDGRAVLSPNPKELARTLDVPEDDVEADTPGHAVALAERAGAVVVTGTATSWIAGPDGRLWRDETGSFGLGISGSGDVKAGLIGGLLARGAEPAQAAAWATHSHGRAGERLSARIGATGFLARELLAEIPGVLVELSS